MHENTIYYINLRQKLFKILGGKTCVCENWACPHLGKCGYNFEPALQFDHVNNDGNKLRKILGSTYQELKYWVDHPELARKKIQVLCANCNWVKRGRNASTQMDL